jgi:hypothetical protein
VELVYTLPALAVLVIAWIAVRRIAGRPRRRLKKYSKWREQRGTTMQQTQPGSKRSDMRAFNDPTTTMDTLQKGRWKGEATTGSGRNSSTRKNRK